MSAANESFENPVSDDLSSDGDTTTIETDPPAGKVAAVDSTVSKDLAGAGDVLDTYTSPLYHPGWKERQPIKWEERRIKLEDDIDDMFFAIDGEGGDKVLSREELKEKLRADDQLEHYLNLVGREASGIFEQIDANSDGVITQEEFQAILNTRGHSFAVAWLEEQIVWHERRNRKAGRNDDVARHPRTNELVSSRDLGQPLPALALLFGMQEDVDGNSTSFITNECAELCQRLWKADLSVDMRISIDKCEILILVGIPNKIMREEAAEMHHLRMRLAKTKGSAEYDEDFYEHYTRYPRHLLGPTGDMFVMEDGRPTDEFAGEEYSTIWTSATRQQVIKHRMMSQGIDVETRMRLSSLSHQLKTCRGRVDKGLMIRAQLLKELLTAAGGYRDHCGKVMGDRVEMLAEQVVKDTTFTIYPEDQMYVGQPVRQEDGLIDDSQSELLEGKKAEVARMQMKVCDEHMLAYGLPLVRYVDIIAVITELESYHGPEGPGQGEVFIGSLHMFFPLHDEEELASLRRNWGNWGLMFRMVSRVLPNESGSSVAVGDPVRTEERTIFWGIPTGFLHQPIDDVRDYFGDGTAMYFAWLETYTKALAWASVVGIPTMMNQWLTEGGVDQNGATLVYSVMLSVWSVLFLSEWKRREAELAFLWGSEGTEQSQQPRKQFKGVIRVNEETKREQLVYGNALARYAVKTVTIIVVLFFMMTTSGLAFTAMGFKFKAPKECNAAISEAKADLDCATWVVSARAVDENSTADVSLIKTADEFNSGCCYDVSLPDEADVFDNLSFWQSKKWIVISAVFNLSVIIGMGLAYEGVAKWLNDKENYRTETEFSDQLIIKNFLFQFVNNYFILFYIAYLRQIEFMGSKKECDMSCLGELQMQMLVVFTGKTFGLQLVELAKPFLVRHAKTLIKMLNLKNLAVGTVNMVTTVVTAPVKMVVHSDGDESDGQRKAEEEAMEADRMKRLDERQAQLDDITDPAAAMDVYEYQTHMVNYEIKGTFDDFNEMAIQYGYVALFSPCFPLAPFFAFLNNVTEIRGDAWKLCKAFQRPSARPQEDIGSWYAVLNSIGFIAVLTNATMIAFVGSQMAQTDWVVPKDVAQATLMTVGPDYIDEFGVSKPAEYGHGMTIDETRNYIRVSGQLPALVDELWATVDTDGDGEIDNSEFPGLLEYIERSAVGGIGARADIAPLWVYALMVEHAVFLTRVLILVFFPTMPDWLGPARDLLKFRVNEMQVQAKSRRDVAADIAAGRYHPEARASTTGSLKVTIVECEGLPKMDRIGDNDNFVRVEITDEDAGGARSNKQTETIENGGATPKWNNGAGETLVFKEIRLTAIDVCMQVFDDGVGNTDDTIGHVKFNLAEVGLHDEGDVLDLWMKLEAGEKPVTEDTRVRFRLQWEKPDDEVKQLAVVEAVQYMYSGAGGVKASFAHDTTV